MRPEVEKPKPEIKKEKKKNPATRAPPTKNTGGPNGSYTGN